MRLATRSLNRCPYVPAVTFLSNRSFLAYYTYRIPVSGLSFAFEGIHRDPKDPRKLAI